MGRRLRSFLCPVVVGAAPSRATAVKPWQSSSEGRCVRIAAMELTWYGRTCIRLRGKDAVVVVDPFQSVVGPTGRGLTGDIVTYSHPDDNPLPRGKGKTSRDGRTLLPASLEEAFVLDGPGEYEVKEVLVTGVRTYRDNVRGAEIGQAGLLRDRARWGPHRPPWRHRPPPVGGEAGGHRAGGHRVRATRRGADRRARPRPSSPSWTHGSWCRCRSREDDACAEALKRFFHEMGAEPSTQPKLSVTATNLPTETTTVLLESRGKQA